MSETTARQPEDLRFLSGLIVVSTEPARLVRFYRDILGVPLAEERHGDSELHWACELGDVHFAIHPAVDYPGEATTAGAVKIAFMVFDLIPVGSLVRSQYRPTQVRGHVPAKDMASSTACAPS